MKRSIVRLIPNNLNLPAAEASGAIDYLEYDIGGRIGRRDPLLPPKWLHSVASQDLNASLIYKDYKEVGEEFFRVLCDYRWSSAGSTSAGCRVWNWSDGSAPYEIFEERQLSRWISFPLPLNGVRKPTLPGTETSIFISATYITNCIIPPENTVPPEYSFPFKTSSFDFVFLTSVFTHMLPQDLDNYLLRSYAS